MSLQEIQDRLKTVNQRTAKNVKIVDTSDLKQNVLYHIAKDKQKELVPNISRRGADSEDNTLPRVHMSTTLLGCVVGYSSMIFDMLMFDTSLKDERKFFKGGYYIYTVPFEHAIKPNAVMVYDQKKSDEHWLISYNKETATFRPSFIDRMFISKLIVDFDKNEGQQFSIEVMISVSKDNVMHLDDKTKLKEGFYRANLVFNNQKKQFSFDDVLEIQEKEFHEERREKTALASHIDQW